MKQTLSAFMLFFLSVQTYGQGMHVKSYNFTSFPQQQANITDVLEKESSLVAKRHPEYGILPYNVQCNGCVELIDERTVDSRFFVDAYSENHMYSQKSYLPLHYKKSENDIWRTIDPLLRPAANEPGVYIANNQPVPTKCDLNKHTSSITEGGFEFEFNKNLSLYFFDENTVYTRTELANYTDYSVGAEGLLVKNIWQGVNMEQMFRAGEVKTNFVIHAPLQLPLTKGWMVIEDHFTLPDGYTFEEASVNSYTADGYYRGDYLLRSPEGEVLITYAKPVYIDAKAIGQHGGYHLIKEDDEYTLQMMVPVTWLLRKENTYPLSIDPLVSANQKWGNYTSSGGASANFGFTTESLGSCDYHLNVIVPGNSALTNAYVDLEYTLTYDSQCGNPPLPAPFCTFSQVTMEVVNDTCGTSTGLLACNRSQPPFTGTCTTDSNLVLGAGPIPINSLTPDYLSCIPPQCPDYDLPFTLKNRDSICGDQCGYLCARGNIWVMTLEACKVEGNITQNATQICAGQPVTFTAHPDCGVPPYHFAWTKDGGNTYDTIYGSPQFVVYPEQNIFVSCVIYDTCESYYLTNDLSVTVIPSPPADAGGDVYLCEGGIASLGGNPTTVPGANVTWSGSSTAVESWLTNKTVSNPQVSVPAGTVDTFFYVVRANTSSCFRTDTMVVYSIPAEGIFIDTSGFGKICEGHSVTISADGNYASYLWSNGSTDASITVNEPGQYSVEVTDSNGCKSTSNIVTVSTLSIPSISVYPDTTIQYGDSVMLYSDIDLNTTLVDSFMWYPANNISCTDCPNPFVSPLDDQYYGVDVHLEGCVLNDSALIRVLLPNNFFIPNSFTPNGDATNETFYVYAQSGVRVFLFQVFDRWGTKVHDGLYPWDGTYKGKPSPPGVYVYVCKLGFFGDDRGVLRKGSVTLLK